ncbi:MAG: biotin/lipoyl-binding protein [Planctomycetaceae bacterium]|nr:biotin/lipoyl-binding protein [Planctomycetaceae bacterium]
MTESERSRDRTEASRWQTIADECLRVFAPLVIVAAGIGGFVVFGQRPEAAPRNTNRDQTAAVETALIEPVDGRFTIEVDGVAVPYKRVTHSAEVAGRITKKVVDCRAGHYVDGGEFLLQIDPTDYEWDVDRLTVQIERADENLVEVEVDLANTEALIELAREDLTLQQQNLARIQRLISSKASTDTQLDSARMQELASRNSLRTLENQRSALGQRRNTFQTAKKLAQTELKRAEINLARTRVAAPLSGTLVSVDVEEGDYVQAGDPLFTINDTDTMEVSCQLRVDELYWVWLQAGTFGVSSDPPAMTFADAASDAGGSSGGDQVARTGLEQPVLQSPGRREVFEIPTLAAEVAFPFRGAEFLWSGVLSRYDGNGLDPSTRTIPCRIRIDAPTRVRIGGRGVAGPVAPPTLFSGMYVKVRIPIETPIPMLRVPLTALQPGGIVWVVRDGQLAIVPAKVARQERETALLQVTSDGPQAGERVVTSPLAAVENGMPVREVNGESSEVKAPEGTVRVVKAEQANEARVQEPESNRPSPRRTR